MRGQKTNLRILARGHQPRRGVAGALGGYEGGGTREPDVIDGKHAGRFGVVAETVENDFILLAVRQ